MNLWWGRDFLTGLKKRLTVHLPNGVPKAEKSTQNENIKSEKMLGAQFGGLAAQFGV